MVHKILIVDDERVIANTLAIIFRDAGYDARAASSAEQALEVVADWCPDLAIIDVILPKMNGIDLAILLKAKCQVTLLSGQVTTSDLLAKAKASGHSFEIVAKPIHPSVLLRVASQLGS